jgi:hypothetical protein
MNQTDHFKIDVVSSPTFERSYCEARLGHYGVMVSEDVPGEFKVTVCSLFPDPETTFYEGVAKEELQVDVDSFVCLLQRCVVALEQLNHSRT